MQTLLGNAPRPNTMIGLTHAADGRKIIKEPKTLKVGIGYPRGKACDVFVNTDGKWVVRFGKKGSDNKLKFESLPPIDNRADAEVAFRKAWKSADVCGYPRKVAYFQFTRPVMDENGAEMYVPDFNAIEAHSFINKDRPGPPTEIDIVFLDDEPFTGGYQMWAASELKCSGDGENALRVISLASTPEEKALAAQAQAEGKKHFPVVGGCWTCNCPYSKETAGNRGPTPAPCKPGADIKFQLSRNIRVGGTAFFHTSSFRSIPQIFSSIERIKELTGGRIAGIPLKMVVRSHKTNHNNQAAIQQNVAIEFRAEDMDSLRKELIETAWKFRNTRGLPSPARAISAPDDALDMETMEMESPMSAQAMSDEFYPDGGEEDAVVVEPVAQSQPVAQATQATQAGVGSKLREARKKDQVVPVVVTPVVPAVTVAPVDVAPVVAAQETVAPAVAAQPAPEPTAPAFVIPEPTPPPAAVEDEFPWTDPQQMMSMFRTQRGRIDNMETFNKILADHGKTGAGLKVDDKVTLKAYRAMEAAKDLF